MFHSFLKFARVGKSLYDEEVLRRLRGWEHLVDVAGGLRAMRGQVDAGLRTAMSGAGGDAESETPEHRTASGGVVVSWRAEPESDDTILHVLTLRPAYDTWWLTGFLMVYVLDRLGLAPEDAELELNRDGSLRLFVPRTLSEHDTLMRRAIEDPPEIGFGELAARLEKTLERCEEPTVRRAPPQNHEVPPGPGFIRHEFE